jgi:hypothetical protein
MDKSLLRKKISLAPLFASARHYKRSLPIISVFVAGLALAPSASSAHGAVATIVSKELDYCITFPDAPIPYIQVGRNFSIQPKGRCDTWSGFTPQNDLNSPSAGTGCTSSSGSNFTLTLTTLEQGDLILDSVSLTLPAQTGTSTELIPSINGYTPFIVPANGARCTPGSNPIPPAPSADVSMQTSAHLSGIGSAPMR